MKIGFLTYSLDTKTGGGRYANDLIVGLQARGHTAVVLKELEDGKPGSVVLKRGWRLFLSIRKVRALLADCDIIHALDGYPYGVIAALANRTLKKKLVITGQGTYAIAPLYNPKTAFLTRYAYRHADQVIAISHFTRSEIEKKIPHLRNSIVINHGIDLETFLHPHDISHMHRSILSVGALKSRKGYGTSILAFAEAAQNMPDLIYHIVGSANPSYRAELEGLIKKNHLEHRIHFHRNISDQELTELYRDSGLFLLMPVNDGHHVEGFGLVYLEAAAQGLPVIGTKGNGGEDAIWHGQNGLLVPQYDSHAAAEAICTILGDVDRWRKMSAASVVWAQKHSRAGMLDQYEAVYHKLDETL
jgi:glycosyltransferase involved in cell wall biosynthesis